MLVGACHAEHDGVGRASTSVDLKVRQLLLYEVLGAIVAIRYILFPISVLIFFRRC